MQRSCICIAIVVVSTTLIAAPLPLQVILRADTPKTIPGIPIDIRIVITNPTKLEVELPDSDVMLRVERVGQPPFWAFDGLDVAGHAAFRLPVCSDRPEEASLLPHSAIEYVLNGDPSGQKSWWEDPRLNVPGVYRLQVVLEPPSWAHGGKRPDDFMSDSALGPDALVSKSLTIVVEEPHGADAEVWGKLVAALQDKELHGTRALRWVDSALAAELLRAYPESRYAPWLAFKLHEWGSAEFRDLFRQKYGSSPLVEVLDFEVLKAASDSFARPESAANVKEITALRAKMQSFLKTAKHPVLQCLVTKELERLSAVARNPLPEQ